MGQRQRQRQGGGGNGNGNGRRPMQRMNRMLDALDRPQDNSTVVEQVTGQRTTDEESTSMLNRAATSAGATGVATEGGVTEDPKTYTPSTYANVYEQNEDRTENLSLDLGTRGADLESFQANWEKNHGRYEAVSAKTGVPAKLVAALHWRESTGDFSTYLHQGDPLGKKAVNEPNDIPIFGKDQWEDAAVHAIKMKQGIIDDVGITAETTDTAAIATFAEAYNGLGYSQYHPEVASPYVYAGTDAYDKGKYVSDGRFSSTHRDQQLGVLAMMDGIGGLDQDLVTATPESRWAKVVAGQKVLRLGAEGDDVEYMQRLLVAAGQATGVDGDFGNGTLKAVKGFQKSKGLGDDGVVGKDTAVELNAYASRLAGAAPTPAPAAPVRASGRR